MSSRIFAAAILAMCSGCYHYTFQERAGTTTVTSVTYKQHVPTYLNGFVGNGRVHTYEYCKQPLRTELRVNPTDVAIALGTLFVYTPHTLYVTCER
jgi:hypothetical protein